MSADAGAITTIFSPAQFTLCKCFDYNYLYSVNREFDFTYLCINLSFYTVLIYYCINILYEIYYKFNVPR